MQKPSTLVELLRSRADRHGSALLYRFLQQGEIDGRSEEWSFAEVDRRARSIAAHLGKQMNRGDRALLLFPPGLDFVAAFFGCLYAGVVAVPAYPPDPTRLARTMPRLRGIVADCDAKVSLTTASLRALGSQLTADIPGLRELRWLAVEELSASDPGSGFLEHVAPDDVAFLQYTSGSTSDPKGVRITHANVMAGEAQIQTVFRCTSEDVAVGWLPLYHDMGLIGNVLQPLYAGFPVTLMSPLDFLARPTRWLTAISHFRATVSGGPDFAYYLCSRRVSEAELASLDLRSWRVAFNGAEPIRHETLQAFAQKMAPAGFHSRAFVPCYGMAEATLLVTGTPPREAPHTREVPRADLGSGSEEGVTTLVSCGRPPSDISVVIVDPKSRRRCEEGEVGEIWVSGPNVSSGYWNAPASKNEEIFAARTQGEESDPGATPYLRTGDLGVSWGDELYVTGRAKDLIIVRGRNFYPQDIERCAEESVPELRPGCSAALGTPDGAAVLVAELRPNTTPERMHAAQTEIRQAVADELGLALGQIVFIRARTIPKTSSGKIQRSKCSAMLEGSELPVVAVFGVGEAAVQAAPEMPTETVSKSTSACDAVPSSTTSTSEVLETVLGFVARALDTDASAIPHDATAASLGLDSVMMMNLQADIEQALEIRLPDFSIWYETTPARLAALVQAAVPAPARGVSRPAAPPRSLTGDLPLSSGQGRLWVLDRLAPDSPLYNLAFGFRIRGDVDLAGLTHAFDTLLQRHPVLRIRMVAPSGEPVARIDGTPRPAVEMIEAPTEGASASDDALRAAIHVWAARPFVLDEGPLMRVGVLPMGRGDLLFCVAMHHAIADGWSIQRLGEELMTIYDASRRGAEARLPAARTYFDYVDAQRLSASETTAKRDFWAKKLAGLPELVLPTRSAGAHASFEGATHAFEIPSSVLQDLRARTGVTPFVAVAAALALVLHRYGGSEDFGLGTVLANRRDPELRDVVGFVANTVVLRCSPRRTTTVRAWLGAVAQLVEEAMQQGDVPFAQVVSAAHGQGRIDQSPLFRAALIYENFAFETRRSGDATFEPLVLAPDGSVPGTAKFDLSLLVAARSDGGLSAAIEYRTALFDAAFIERMSGHLHRVLVALAEDQECPLGKVPLLTATERRDLVESPAVLRRDYRRDATIHALVQAQVLRTPDATAVVFDDERLSYRELDDRAEEVASRLAKHGLGPGDRVVISVRRSIDMIVGLLGILKTGAAYVPVDPEYPAERRRYVLEDSGAAAVVAHGPTSRSFADGTVPVVLIDRPEPSNARLDPARHAPAQPDALMYMIYTSGSTGKPKGVRVPHRCVAAFLDAMDERLGVPEKPQEASWLALSSISFDISVLEIFWPLVHGMTVVVQEELMVSRAAGSSSARSSSETSVEYGLFYFASEDGDTPGPDRYRLLLEGAKFADDRGFSSVWMPERHFHAFGGLYPNPSVTAAAVAALTKRVALRAGSVVLPLHHPVRVAEEWSVVDNLSGGRVGLSVASGWHANDFVFAPHNYRERREAMEASLDTLRRLWRGESVAFPNGEGNPHEVSLRPRPVQRELPVWMTAAGSPSTFESAGRIGAGILTHLLGQSLEELRDKLAIYRRARARAGHEGPGNVTLMLHTFVGHDPEFVRAQIEVPFRNYLKSSSDLLRGLAPSLGLGNAGASFSDEELDVLVEHAFKRYVEHAGLFGTPATCRDRVAEIAAMGVTEIGCLVDFGIPTPIALEHLEALDELRRRGPTTQYSIPAQVERRKITHLQCTPSLAQMLAFDDASLDALANVDLLLLGGEAMPTTLAERLLARRAELKRNGALINMYGPTETTIWSTTYHVDRIEQTIPIGQPIANTRTYVLDVDFQPCPVGVPGELFIAGEGVVAGYHQRPELDAERFLPDPFVAGEKMYRTGDRVQWREDGNLAYLGRTDFQVKLRGHRIELGEIEAALESLQAVERAVTRVWGETVDTQQLVAYVMASDPLEESGATAELESRLRRELADVLPAAMLPSAFVFLPELPRTPNGKVDRNALPSPRHDTKPGATDELTPPRNDLERDVARIWGEVLGRDHVGRDQSFFDLGGHSLLMARVHARLKADLSVDVPLVRLFQYPTIAALVGHLEQGGGHDMATTVATIEKNASRERQALRRLGRRGRSTSVV